MQNTTELIGRINGLSDKDVYLSKERYGDNSLTRQKKQSFFTGIYSKLR